MSLMKRTLSDALDLTMKDPWVPATNYLEHCWDVSTFCALVWILCGEQFNYYKTSTASGKHCI